MDGLAVDAPGRVVFLNGIPNAGKTTLAHAVQTALDEPYWHLSLDDFLRGYVDRHRVASGGQLFPAVMLGYLHSLRQLALCGNNIVAEAVITPDRLQLYLDLFGDLPVLLVGLHVPFEEAQRRERQRTDRQPYEVTVQDMALVHAHGLYDLELDMVQLRPTEAAQQVLALMAKPPSPTALQQLIAQTAAPP